MPISPIARTLMSTQLFNSAEAAVLNIVSEIALLRDQGLTQTRIRNQIFTLIGGGTGGLEALLGRASDSVQKVAQKSYGDGQREVLLADRDPAEDLFMWNALGSDSCIDCVARHGIVRTYEEWERIGIPDAGATVCRHHCRCSLTPAEVAMKQYGADSVDSLESLARKPIQDRSKQVNKLIKLRGESFSESTIQRKLGQFRERNGTLGEGPSVTGEQRISATLERDAGEFARTGNIREVTTETPQERNARETGIRLLAERRTREERELQAARNHTPSS